MFKPQDSFEVYLMHHMLKIFGIDFNDQCDGTLNKLGHYVALHISCHFVFIHSITKTRLKTCHVVSVS